jgi:hypothetical protein
MKFMQPFNRSGDALVAGSVSGALAAMVATNGLSNGTTLRRGAVKTSGDEGVAAT